MLEVKSEESRLLFLLDLQITFKGMLKLSITKLLSLGFEEATREAEQVPEEKTLGRM